MQDAHAVIGHQRFGGGFQVKHAHVAAAVLGQCFERGHVVHAAERRQAEPLAFALHEHRGEALA